MSKQSSILIDDQPCPVIDLSPWLDKFDRQQQLMVLLSLSTRITDDNLESVVFSAILDRLCSDDRQFCACLVDAMLSRLSARKCHQVFRRLNDRLAADILSDPDRGGSHD